MDVDVYQTDAEAFGAAAALVAETLRAASAARGRATLALAGGRGGRGVMVALAERSDVPWDRIEWFWGDERCVPVDDPRSNVRLARESLLGPRGIPAARIHPPPVELARPEAIADGYASLVATMLGPAAVFDAVMLGVGVNGHVASLMPGCRALAATAPVAAVTLAEVTEEPLVARITVTPPVLHAARHVVVVVAGAQKARPVAAALRGPEDPARVPAQLVRPSSRVRWVIDRAAAGELLRDARPGPQ
ncbi:MAG TPA: 6-phosphogluconolactonase [Solirubrobacteraceae bacterium]|jgi:6-phosphogluconolactonase